ncbi:hypothetical protein [Pseudomonas phage phiPst2111]|nr:hypothetical protein [Pseudomonas phage phiPst2111]
MNRAMPPPTNRVKEVTFKVSRPDGQYGLHKLADTTFALGLFYVTHDRNGQLPQGEGYYLDPEALLYGTCQGVVA